MLCQEPLGHFDDFKKHTRTPSSVLPQQHKLHQKYVIKMKFKQFIQADIGLPEKNRANASFAGNRLLKQIG